MLVLAQKQFRRCHHECKYRNANMHCRSGCCTTCVNMMNYCGTWCANIVRGQLSAGEFIEPNTSGEGVENCIKFQEYYYCTVSPLKFTSRKPLIPFICHLIIFHMRHKHTHTHSYEPANSYELPSHLVLLLIIKFTYKHTHTHACLGTVCVCAYLLEKRYFAGKKYYAFFPLLFVMNSAQNNNERV